MTKARDRVGVEPVRHLFETSAEAWQKRTDGLRFHGRRVWAIDGSLLKTPDSKENRGHFGKHRGYRGEAAYPQLRLVALFDVGSHLFTDIRFGPQRTAEMPLARKLLASIEEDSLVILDRNFIAYDLLWDLSNSRGADFLIRVRNTVKTREVMAVGTGDRIVEVDIHRQSRRCRPDIPETWRLREITFRAPRAKEETRLLTTVVDTTIPGEELAALYHERWEEEAALDELKTHLCNCTQVNRPVLFRSQTPERVEQELYGLLIAHNAIRMIMAQAAELLPIYCLRLSYTAAIERIREATRDMMRTRTAVLLQRYEEMLHAISRSKVPKRPGRHNPRVVKVKMSRYRLKRTG